MPGSNYTLVTETSDNKSITLAMNSNNQLESFKIDEAVFNLSHELGRGKYAIVAAYHDKTSNKTIAVKSPLNFITKNRDLQNTAREFTYALKALNNRGLLHLTLFQLPELTDDNQEQFGYLMFLPYLEGQALIDSLHSVTSRQELLKNYLAVANELERLHQIGIVHKDIHGSNFIIDNNFQATAIDFMFASNIGKQITFQIKPPQLGETISKYAPEIWTTSAIALSQPSIDAYGYASMAQFEYTYNTRWIEDSTDKRSCSQSVYYPNDFLMLCHQGLSVNPDQRPSMTDFINILKKNMIVNPQRVISFINMPLSFESIIMTYGQQTGLAETPFKSQSGSNNLIFTLPSGKLRAKFSRKTFRAEHYGALLLQRKLYPQFAEQFNAFSLENFLCLSWKHDYKHVQISPDFPGVSYENYDCNNKSELEIARTHLAIFEEAQRMYDLGILHGNLQASNIIIDDKQANSPKCYLTKLFIGSYRLDGALARTEDCNDGYALHRAPELRKRSRITPAIEQEMFPLGYALRENLINKNPDDTRLTIKIIKEFVDKAVSINPSDRPNSLLATINALSHRIEALTREEKNQNPVTLIKTLPPIKTQQSKIFPQLTLFDLNAQQEIRNMTSNPVTIQVKEAKKQNTLPPIAKKEDGGKSTKLVFFRAHNKVHNSSSSPAPNSCCKWTCF